MNDIRKVPLPEKNISSDKDHGRGLKVESHKWCSGFQESRPLYPDGFEEAERRSPTWFRNERCQYYLMVAVPEGEMRYYGNGESFLLRGSKILIIPQGTDYSFKTTPSCYYRKISIYLLGVDLHSISSSLGLDQMELIKVSDLNYYISTMRKLDKLLLSKNVNDMPFMAGMTFELLNRLSMEKIAKNQKPLLFLMLKSRLSSDFRRTVKISELAEEYNVSVITIERMFKKELNITPAKFRIISKMNHAEELLKHSSLSIKEIAYELGYCHQFHFSNEFRRISGASPEVFRKKS